LHKITILVPTSREARHCTRWNKITSSELSFYNLFATSSMKMTLSFVVIYAIYLFAAIC
jgi:hypothetical protein